MADKDRPNLISNGPCVSMAVRLKGFRTSFSNCPFQIQHGPTAEGVQSSSFKLSKYSILCSTRITCISQRQGCIRRSSPSLVPQFGCITAGLYTSTYPLCSSAAIGPKLLVYQQFSHIAPPADTSGPNETTLCGHVDSRCQLHRLEGVTDHCFQKEHRHVLNSLRYGDISPALGSSKVCW